MREGWEYKRLGELCDIVMGQSPMGNSINENNGIEFHQGKTNFGDKFLMESGIYTTSPIRIAEKKTILLCVRAPVGIINITERQVCIGRGLSSLKPRLGLELLYLYYCLLSKQNYFESNSTGSTFKAISSKVINNTIIQFPPKPTQLSIVSELDKLNELIQIKKEQLKDYDALAQSIFYEMFGDPVVNEKGWEVMSLGDICEITSSKRVFANEYVDMGVPFYRSKEVIEKSKQLPISVELYISESHYDKIKSSFGVPQIGDILVTAVGTIGKIWVVDTNEPFYFKDGNLVWLRKIKGVHSEYFRYSLFYLIDEYKKVNANGAAYNALTIAKLKLMLCPLPPLSLQQSFAHKIEQIERQKAAVQRTIKDLETLLAVRMQYWFE